MEHFLPVNTPPKASPQKNLTGNPRLIKDLVADVYGEIQRWNDIHLHGLSLLKRITSMKVDDSYPEGLQELCDELEQDVDSLDLVVGRLKLAVHRVNSIAAIHKTTDKLFSTWDIERFVDKMNEIYGSYQCEAEFKRKILENVAHGYEDPWKMLHLTAWVHQPMIPHYLNVTLESLLIETGHR